MSNFKRLRGMFLGTVISVILVVGVLVTISIFFSESAMAAVNVELQTALAGLKTCYVDGGIRKTLSANDYNANALTYGADNTKIKILLPSGKEVSCQQLLYGGNGFTGLTSAVSTPSASADPAKKGEFLTNMGYQASSSSGSTGSSCATFVYNVDSWMPGQTIFEWGGTHTYYTTRTTLCGTTRIDASGDAVIDTSKSKKLDFTIASTNTDGSNPGFSVGGLNINTGSNNKITCSDGFGNDFATVSFTDGEKWNTFIDDVISSGCAKETFSRAGNLGGTISSTRDGIPERDPGGTAAAEYSIEGREAAAANTAISFLSNNSISGSNLGLSEDQKATLLQSYLKDTFNASNAGCNLTGDALKTAEGDGYVEARIDTGEGFQMCYIKPSDSNKNKKVYGWNSSGVLSKSEEWDFNKVVAELKGMTIPALSDPSAVGALTSSPSTSTTDPDGDTDTSETPFCTQVSGVLSWVFCPVLNFVGETVGKIYEWIEDSFLTVPASVMSQDSGTYDGWAQFRNFANILFAVLFAIVILSQITGIGISNYNVKKMLPRLIMVVVLVNISFILCQLAVDLSNLVGHGINQLLSGFAEGGTFNLGAVQGLTTALVSGTTADVEASFSGLWGGIGTAAAVLAAVATWKLWLLPLLLALVSALIAVVFFFLILGVRQAGVIIMVVLAPMAIVCYALPNTKSLFDKWWKIFSALLMVYPICGAMMGGGTFAASIMIANDPGNFLYFIIAMLLTIAPFFFIPSVLRNSLNGVASLGSKFAKLGGGLGKDARRIAERSNTFQDAKSQLGYRRAQAAMNRYEGKGLVGRGIKKLSSSKLGQAVGKSPVGALGRGIGVMGDYVGKKTGITAARQRSYMRNAKLAAQGKRIQYEANNADSFLAGEESRQRATDISNAKARYLDAKNSPIDTGDFVSMQREYDKQLDALLANPEDDSAIANVAALQDIMSATDDGAAVMMSTLTTKADQHSGTNNGKAALRKAAAHIDAGAFKSRNRSFYKMATDFANGNFGQVGGGLSTYDSDIEDKAGNKIPPLSYLKGYHNSPASLKYTAANFGNLDNSAYKQILNGIQTGEIKEDKLQNLLETVNEAMSNENIHLDNNAADYARQILSAGYAQSASLSQPSAGGGAGGSSTPSVARTVGSQAIAHAASVKSINNLTSRVQSGDIKPEEAVKIANNMLTSVRDNTNSFSAEKLAAMKNYASAVNQLGATDSSGQPINFDTREFDSAQINVHGGRTSSTPTPAPTPTPSTPSTRPGTVSGTQIVQTPNPGGSTTTQVRGWSGQIIGGGSSETTTPGGIILTGDAADQLRNSSRQQGNNQQGGQGGNGGGSAAP